MKFLPTNVLISQVKLSQTSLACLFMLCPSSPPPLLFQLPDLLLTFLHFLAAFSLGLGLLNLVPCYLLDGQHIARAAVDLLLAHSAAEVGRVNIF